MKNGKNPDDSEKIRKNKEKLKLKENKRKYVALMTKSPNRPTFWVKTCIIKFIYNYVHIQLYSSLLRLIEVRCFIPFLLF